MAKPSTDRGAVEAVRQFNRFYTRQLGLLDEGLLNSEFSLTEVRILYELAQRDGRTSAELRTELGLDAGYLSRILKKFEAHGLIARSASAADARQAHLRLTAAGRTAFKPLNKASQVQIEAMLAPLAPAEAAGLRRAMLRIQHLLSPAAEPAAPYILRPYQVGDIGWIVHRQGLLYAREYGWDETFEALVAEIAAAFIKKHDPQRERCWIAERDGEIVGSVFLVRQSAKVAKLRLLYVEPAARGLGIGARLTEECIRFARRQNYRTLTLWTNHVLVSARRIYQAAGFRLVKEEKHHSFGKDQVGQTWELEL